MDFFHILINSFHSFQLKAYSLLVLNIIHEKDRLLQKFQLEQDDNFLLLDHAKLLQVFLYINPIFLGLQHFDIFLLEKDNSHGYNDYHLILYPYQKLICLIYLLLLQNAKLLFFLLCFHLENLKLYLPYTFLAIL